MTALFDGKHNVTRWNHEPKFSRVQKIFPDNTTQTTEFFPEGRVKSILNPARRLTEFRYDPAGNLTRQFSDPNIPHAFDFTFEYEPQRNLRSIMRDELAVREWSYIYNDLALLTQENGPFDDDTIVYDHDELARPASWTINGIGESIQRDTFGRNESITNPLGTFGFHYLPNLPELDNVTLPNGLTTRFEYGTTAEDRRLKAIIHETTGGTVSRHDYLHNAAGILTRWTQAVGTEPARAWKLEHSPLDELLAVRDPVTGEELFGYTYDTAGNRDTERLNGTPRRATHNNLNQITERSPGGRIRIEAETDEPARVTINNQPAKPIDERRFEGEIHAQPGENMITLNATDGSGNTTTKSWSITVPDGPAESDFAFDANGNMLTGGGLQYEYDALDRLVRISNIGGDPDRQTLFEYDPLGRRIRLTETDGGAVLADKRHIWVGLTPAEERVWQTNTTAKRFYDSGVSIVDQESQISSSYYYTRDHLGSIREVTDSTGTVVARHDYDPYGRVTQTAGTFTADFAFTGHYHHKPSGLHLAPYRAYNPDLGRWINRDPISEDGGINLYGYVGGGVIDAIDPLGLDDLNYIQYNKAPKYTKAVVDNAPLRADSISVAAHGTPGKAFAVDGNGNCSPLSAVQIAYDIAGTEKYRKGVRRIELNICFAGDGSSNELASEIKRILPDADIVAPSGFLYRSGPTGFTLGKSASHTKRVETFPGRSDWVTR